MSNQTQRPSQRLPASVFLGLTLVLAVPACGQRPGSEDGSSSLETNAISLRSADYNDATGLVSEAPPSEFKFCASKIELESSASLGLRDGGGDDDFSSDDYGEDDHGEDDSFSLEKRLGLVDVSDAAAFTTWGQLTVPIDFSMRELKVEVHKDPETCPGADYSVAYDGLRLNSDLEFKFEFSPPVVLVAGATVTLRLDEIATALASAAASGKLNDATIGEFLTSETMGVGEID
jgi:hypothetical protein